MKNADTEQPDVKPLADDNTVILDTPIRRGTTTIDSGAERLRATGDYEAWSPEA